MLTGAEGERKGAHAVQQNRVFSASQMCISLMRFCTLAVPVDLLAGQPRTPRTPEEGVAASLPEYQKSSGRWSVWWRSSRNRASSPRAARRSSTCGGSTCCTLCGPARAETAGGSRKLHIRASQQTFTLKEREGEPGQKHLLSSGGGSGR